MILKEIMLRLAFNLVKLAYTKHTLMDAISKDAILRQFDVVVYA